MREMSPTEKEARKHLIEEAIPLMLELIISDIDMITLDETLGLDHEDIILFEKFQDPNYVDEDPHYFEKALRVVRRIRKLFDAYMGTLN